MLNRFSGLVILLTSNWMGRKGTGMEDSGAYVWLQDGRMLNEEIVRAGFAGLMTYPPNIRHLRRLHRLTGTPERKNEGYGAIGETNEKDPRKPDSR